MKNERDKKNKKEKNSKTEIKQKQEDNLEREYEKIIENNRKELRRLENQVESINQKKQIKILNELNQLLSTDYYFNLLYKNGLNHVEGKIAVENLKKQIKNGQVQEIQVKTKLKQEIVSQANYKKRYNSASAKAARNRQAEAKNKINRFITDTKPSPVPQYYYVDKTQETFKVISKRNITLSMRVKVFERDNYTCQMCGKTVKDGVKLEVDHIKPVSKGGSDDMSNLLTLCFDCNRGKSDKDLENFLKNQGL